MRHLNRRPSRIFFVVAALLLTPVTVDAQMRRPRANITPIAEASGVHPGTTARVALKVSLPGNLHVQSDRPRDPLLIPTVLTLEPPAGVTLRGTEAVYSWLSIDRGSLRRHAILFGSPF